MKHAFYIAHNFGPARLLTADEVAAEYPQHAAELAEHGYVIPDDGDEVAGVELFNVAYRSVDSFTPRKRTAKTAQGAIQRMVDTIGARPFDLPGYVAEDGVTRLSSLSVKVAGAARPFELSFRSLARFQTA